MARTARIALVTGANKGIGFEVTRQLAREGFRVFLGARNEEAGRAAAEKLSHEGRKLDHGEVTFLQIDIANPESIEQAANEFGKQCDRLDVLVNNAGIALPDDNDILSITPGTFAATLRTNTLGA
ncbi:MAG TPA: SDR family NAD(P)-dependent oxidoreductase, partial [Chthoniobacterales bacterium]